MPAEPPAWTRTPTPFATPANERNGVGRIVRVVLVKPASIGIVTW
jgi:hypothetical protein